MRSPSALVRRHSMQVLALVTCIAPLMATGAFAQASSKAGRFAFGANGAWFMIGGQDFQATNNGGGGEVYASARVAGPLLVGVGGHYSTHGTIVTNNLHISGVFLQSELERRVGRRAGIRAGLRGGWIHRSIVFAGTTYSSSGHAFGGIAAASVRVVAPVALDLSVSFDFISLGPFASPGTNDTGSAFGLHAGLRFETGH